MIRFQQIYLIHFQLIFYAASNIKILERSITENPFIKDEKSKIVKFKEKKKSHESELAHEKEINKALKDQFRQL